jgi:hypothetical protein
MLGCLVKLMEEVKKPKCGNVSTKRKAIEIT